MPNNVDGFTPLPAEPGLYDQLIDQQLHEQLNELAQVRLAPDIKQVDPQNYLIESENWSVNGSHAAWPR